LVLAVRVGGSSYIYRSRAARCGRPGRWIGGRGWQRNKVLGWQGAPYLWLMTAFPAGLHVRPAVRQQLNMGLTANNPSPFQERFPFIYGVRFQSPALYLSIPRIRPCYFTNPSAPDLLAGFSSIWSVHLEKGQRKPRLDICHGYVCVSVLVAPNQLASLRCTISFDLHESWGVRKGQIKTNYAGLRSRLGKPRFVEEGNHSSHVTLRACMYCMGSMDCYSSIYLH
jgi:hypothetical protein